MNNPSTTPYDDLDEVDRQMISFLQEDGRNPFSQIAKRLKVSPGMIRLRYNRLVEKGILKVVAITNPLNMGYTKMALIGIKVDGGKLKEVLDRISALEEVIYLIVVSGRFDIIAEVMCREHDDLLEFLMEKLFKIDGIRETESFIHLRIIKEIYF